MDRRCPDPYADHDPVSTARFAGLVWMVWGVVLLAVLPIAADGRPVTLVAGILMGALAAGGGASLARGSQLPYGLLLALNLAGVGLLAALQASMDPAGGQLLDELYLGLALQAGALHPLRRTAWVLVAIAAASVAQETHAGWTTDGAADMMVHAGVWLFVALIANSLVCLMRAERAAARSEEALAQTLASTDALTGLGNRRRLLSALDEVVQNRTPVMLALFDLDGFKAYNDSFGHPAGDALLRKLSTDLLGGLAPGAQAYRIGGDEFCVLAPGGGGEHALAAAADALSEHGDAFEIGASVGAVWLPGEATDVDQALRIADRRMYAHKASGRTSAGRQSTDVLLRVLRERSPSLGEHVDGVTRLCGEVARELGIEGEERTSLLQAAALHDVGKAAIPDVILAKPGALDEQDWDFIRQHTVMGERIMAAAPALARAARFVRSSHERMDGDGYPDGLRGVQIPLASRVIAACDAYDAMITDRPYRGRMGDREALEELGRCAGSQFDPGVVMAIGVVVGRGAVLAPSPA